MAKYKSERKLKRQREQRRNTMIAVLVIAVGLVILIALPSIVKSAQPVGEIIEITPVARPSADGRTMGDPNAPVRIDVFEDFLCSACASYTFEIEKQVITDLIPSGNVYYVFRQFPFLDDRSAVKQSDQAANASMCALEQGRFWDYHDMLYANQSGSSATPFSENRLIAFSETLGIDVQAFENCLNSSRYQSEIDQDIADGTRLGVTGTPSVFVNGKIVRPGYVPSFLDIQEAVNAALAE